VEPSAHDRRRVHRLRRLGLDHPWRGPDRRRTSRSGLVLPLARPGCHRHRIAGCSALLGLSWQAAALLFALLSVGAVILGRFATRSTTQHDAEATPLNQRGQSLVGRVFTLETPIKDGEGRIRVDDSSWRVTGADRFAGAKVRVVRVEGSTLVVDDP